MTEGGGDPVDDLVERLRARAKRVQSQIENSQRVVELMQPELDRFDKREGHNIYTTRLAVDHVSAIRTDRKELADWTEAADTLESLTRDLAEARGKAIEEAALYHEELAKRAEQNWRRARRNGLEFAHDGQRAAVTHRCHAAAIRSLIQKEPI